MQRIALALLFLVAVQTPSFATIKEEVAKTIVRVHSGSKYSTGFFWRDGNTVLTTLHSLSSLNGIEVFVPSIGDWRQATLQKVYLEGDLISLQIGNYTSPNYLSSRYTDVPVVDTRSFTIGYNSGSVKYIDRDFTVGLLEGNTLSDLLPASARHEILNLRFPSLTTQIVYLKGNLLHGFSGSPIVDLQGKLIGIADGGLENGAAGISWCINASHISNLENSNEDPPVLNQSAINTLFASEEYESKDDDGNNTIDINDFRFIKTKTRTFAQLNRTGNYTTFREMGLDQLLGFFTSNGIAYDNFTYDIYVEEKTGATLVIPSDLELTKEGDFLTTQSADGKYKTYIILETTFNVQQTSLDFGNQLMAQMNTFNWVQDPRLSFLAPLIRPDQVVINRKAFYTNDFRNYGFQVLAGKQNIFFGIFTRVMDGLNPANMFFYNPSEVAKYNLAAQLTTFTN